MTESMLPPVIAGGVAGSLRLGVYQLWSLGTTSGEGIERMEHPGNQRNIDISMRNNIELL